MWHDCSWLASHPASSQQPAGQQPASQPANSQPIASQQPAASSQPAASQPYSQPVANKVCFSLSHRINYVNVVLKKSLVGAGNQKGTVTRKTRSKSTDHTTTLTNCSLSALCSCQMESSLRGMVVPGLTLGIVVFLASRIWSGERFPAHASLNPTPKHFLNWVLAAGKIACEFVHILSQKLRV